MIFSDINVDLELLTGCEGDIYFVRS